MNINKHVDEITEQAARRLALLNLGDEIRAEYMDLCDQGASQDELDELEEQYALTLVGLDLINATMEIIGGAKVVRLPGGSDRPPLRPKTA